MNPDFTLRVQLAPGSNDGCRFRLAGEYDPLYILEVRTIDTDALSGLCQRMRHTVNNRLLSFGVSAQIRIPVFPIRNDTAQYKFNLYRFASAELHGVSVDLPFLKGGRRFKLGRVFVSVCRNDLYESSGLHGLRNDDGACLKRGSVSRKLHRRNFRCRTARCAQCAVLHVESDRRQRVYNGHRSPLQVHVRFSRIECDIQLAQFVRESESNRRRRRSERVLAFRNAPQQVACQITILRALIGGYGKSIVRTQRSHPTAVVGSIRIYADGRPVFRVIHFASRETACTVGGQRNIVRHCPGIVRHEHPRLHACGDLRALKIYICGTRAAYTADQRNRSPPVGALKFPVIIRT